MPTYLVIHNERRGEDVVLEDPNLAIELTPDWALFTDEAGTCYAIPREQIRSIMRVDEPPEPEEPAPQKE